MLVGAFGASAFGLRGGIPMEAAQTSLYRAPASRADITRSKLLPITHSLMITKKRGASMPRLPPLNVCGCTRRTKVRK